MEFEEEKKSSTLDTIIIIAGLAFLFWMFKSNHNQQTSSQPIESHQQYIQEPISRYENAENWEVVRGEDGFISNVRALRDATVGSGTSYQSSGHIPSVPPSPSSPVVVGSDLDRTIKEMIQKNIREMNEFNQRFGRLGRLSDRDRSDRYGFA
jgi:hypothetical protein